jgi:hypothetical protein
MLRMSFRLLTSLLLRKFQTEALSEIVLICVAVMPFHPITAVRAVLPSQIG